MGGAYADDRGGARAGGRHLLEREVAGERLAQHAELDARAFDADIRPGRQVEANGCGPERELLRDGLRRVVDGEAELAVELNGAGDQDLHVALNAPGDTRRTQDECALAVSDFDNFGRAGLEGQAGMVDHDRSQ